MTPSTLHLLVTEWAARELGSGHGNRTVEIRDIGTGAGSRAVLVIVDGRLVAEGTGLYAIEQAAAGFGEYVDDEQTKLDVDLERSVDVVDGRMPANEATT